jgi:hypothetical protein
MAFDVLEGGAEGQKVDRLADFIQDVPIEGEGERGGHNHHLSVGGCKRGPFIVKQIGGGRWVLVATNNVNERAVVAYDGAMGRRWHMAVFEEADEEAKEG